MTIKLTLKIVLIFFLLIISGLSQNNTDSLTNENYFIGFNFGRSFIQDGYEETFNFGIFLSLQDWPHLFKVNYNNNFEFPIGESNSNIGFIPNLSELNFTYNYLVQIPKVKLLFFSFGSGIGLIKVKRNVAYVSDKAEEAITDTFLRLGIPFEIQFGFLYPNKMLRLLNFIYFFNANSVENFNGWKLNFNISIK